MEEEGKQTKATSNNLVMIDNPSSKANIEAVDNGEMHGKSERE